MKKNKNKLLIFLDIVIIFISLISSWMIRSRFRDFLYTIDRLYFILPYVVLIRIISNFLFEEYSYKYKKVYIEDIKKIFFHNIFPSLVFTGLRFFSPVHMSRMPLAMIFVEYFLTTACMVLLRFMLIDNKKSGPLDSIKIERKAFIIAFKIGKNEKKQIKKISDNYIFEINTILTHSSYEWETDINGIKIAGDIRLADKILSEDTNINNLVMVGRCSREQALYVLEIIKKYALNYYAVDNCCELFIPDSGYFANDCGLKSSYIPESVNDFFKDNKIKLKVNIKKDYDWNLPDYVEKNISGIIPSAVLSIDDTNELSVFRTKDINRVLETEKFGYYLFIDDIYFKLKQYNKILGYMIKSYYLFCNYKRVNIICLSDNSACEKILEKYINVKNGRNFKEISDSVNITVTTAEADWKITEFSNIYFME